VRLAEKRKEAEAKKKKVARRAVFHSNCELCDAGYTATPYKAKKKRRK